VHAALGRNAFDFLQRRRVDDVHRARIRNNGDVDSFPSLPMQMLFGRPLSLTFFRDCKIACVDDRQHLFGSLLK
jgi:hypothetical protein